MWRINSNALLTGLTDSITIGPQKLSKNHYHVSWREHSCALKLAYKFKGNDARLSRFYVNKEFRTNPEAFAIVALHLRYSKLLRQLRNLRSFSDTMHIRANNNIESAPTLLYM